MAQSAVPDIWARKHVQCKHTHTHIKDELCELKYQYGLARLSALTWHIYRFPYCWSFFFALHWPALLIRGWSLGHPEEVVPRYRKIICLCIYICTIKIEFAGERPVLVTFADLCGFLQLCTLALFICVLKRRKSHSSIRFYVLPTKSKMYNKT